MARRRSARLANAAVKQAKAAPVLSSVAERETTPVRHGPQSIDGALAEPKTPASAAVKPSFNEMHPSRFHQSTGEPSSGLRLGFADIPAQNDAGTGLTSTPSKVAHLPASPFTFRRTVRPDELGDSAQRLRQKLSDKVALIKADLVAKRDAEGDSMVNLQARPIAKPKGKSGRFSAAHMSEFKKMDSIQGHASAWRAQPGRFTPVTSGKLKRSSSKANLDETPTGAISVSRNSPAKSRAGETKELLTRKLKPTLHGSNGGATASSPKTQPGPTATRQQSTAKRQKQCKEHDSSMSRPVSRDASSLPRPAICADGSATQFKPRSGLARLLSPTKSFLAHSARSDQPPASLLPSPSKQKLTKSTSMGHADLLSGVSRAKDCNISPNGLGKFKSILRKQTCDFEAAKSAIPQPAIQASQTPKAPRLNKELPSLPMTTPRRKLTKRVTLAKDQNEAPKAISRSSPTPMKPKASAARPALRELDVEYPTLDESLAETYKSGENLYPDLSPLRRLVGNVFFHGRACSPKMAGSFTFRSDHTIKLGNTPVKGFGSCLGQSSVRQVGSSAKDVQDLPGRYPAPASPSSHSDKENCAPVKAGMLHGTAHGMLNKKRHRATSDEEDAELMAAERARKKSKMEHSPHENAEQDPQPRLTPDPPTGACIGQPQQEDAYAEPQPPQHAGTPQEPGLMKRRSTAPVVDVDCPDPDLDLHWKLSDLKIVL
ncbi:hypothetical protein CDD82_6610 [Ophiocordyceps australis]|uniref:Uncharacterized protein n=1 Tax=Ophiocordyceps australis TaxID=1399860 RepID=A0A2C5ZUN1_9HYPO|nr:hypothetical protein CDD82_6610 [Ophiocordyceps australis]